MKGQIPETTARTVDKAELEIILRQARINTARIIRTCRAGRLQQQTKGGADA
jgi:hypothetical protein